MHPIPALLAAFFSTLTGMIVTSQNQPAEPPQIIKNANHAAKF